MYRMEYLINQIELSIHLKQSGAARQFLDIARQEVLPEDKETRTLLHDYGNAIQKLVFAEYIQEHGLTNRGFEGK